VGEEDSEDGILGVVVNPVVIKKINRMDNMVPIKVKTDALLDLINYPPVIIRGVLYKKDPSIA